MLDPWIIEKTEEKPEQERPVIHLPLPSYPCKEEKDDVQSDRGVVIIEIGYDEEEKEN